MKTFTSPTVCGIAAVTLALSACATEPGNDPTLTTNSDAAIESSPPDAPSETIDPGQTQRDSANADEIISGGVRLEAKEGKIKAGDKDSVFTVGEKSKEAKGSPRDIEKKLGINRGKANNSVTFDAKPDEITDVKNPLTGANEKVLKGDVDLKDRNPEFN